MSTAKVFFLFEGLRKERPGQKNKTKHNATHLCGFGDGKGVCSFVCVCVCVEFFNLLHGNGNAFC